MTMVATRPSPTQTLPTHLPEDHCRPQRVLIVDEHELIQVGLRSVLKEAPWVESCLIAGSAEAAYEIARRHQVQLVLISASLGGRSGLELCRLLKSTMPHVKVVLMAGEGRVSASMALSFGAVGALSKHLPRQTILAMAKRIVDGGPASSRRARWLPMSTCRDGSPTYCSISLAASATPRSPLCSTCRATR